MDRVREHDVSESVACAALGSDEVTDYTNIHGMKYLERTAINEAFVVDVPSVCADVVVAHANVLMCPIDGGTPGSGVETGTLM